MAMVTGNGERNLVVAQAPAVLGDAQSESLTANAHLLDALSYVEPKPAAAASKLVNDLIEAEMAASARSIPLPALPAEARLNLQGMAASELARVARGVELEPLSIARYSCEPPDDSLRADAGAWRTALQNCCAQLEHQANRVVNLELAESFGEAAWARHVQDLERLKTQLEALAESKRREAETINLRRKADQDTIAPELIRLELERLNALQKHMQLEYANAALRARIAQTEAYLAAGTPA